MLVALTQSLKCEIRVGSRGRNCYHVPISKTHPAIDVVRGSASSWVYYQQNNLFATWPYHNIPIHVDGNFMYFFRQI